MVIATIDLSKPRKFAKYHIDNVLLDLRMKNIDVDRYGKIALSVAIGVGASLVIPNVIHAQPFVVDDLPCPPPNSIDGLLRTVDGRLTQVYSHVPHLNETRYFLNDVVSKVIDAPANFMLRNQNTTRMTPWIPLIAIGRAIFGN